MNKNLKMILQLGVVVVVLSLGYWYYDMQKPGELDNFAKCLEQKGAKFYGAFWCPHCQAQKALFGKSKKYLPYVECSNSDMKTQTQICKDKNIEGHPTWEFRTGTSTALNSGEKTLKQLSEITGCELPQAAK